MNGDDTEIGRFLDRLHVAAEAERANGVHVSDGHPQEPGADCAPWAESIARRFHDEYERLAPSFGYETRPDSAVAWEDVPEPNRRLMVATIAAVLTPEGYKIGRSPFFTQHPDGWDLVTAVYAVIPAQSGGSRAGER